MDERFENNRVSLGGEIVSGFEFSHKRYGEEFYITKIAIERLSGALDIIPVMVSERLVDVSEDLTCSPVEVFGQIRSYTYYKNGKIMLYMFAKEIFVHDASDGCRHRNNVILNGYICRPTIYRKTPFGREVTDIYISVNRKFNKSDCIPCIAWGRGARLSEKLNIGSMIHIAGRMQSREYKKKISNEEFESRVAYEVSISMIEEVSNEKGID